MSLNLKEKHFLSSFVKGSFCQDDIHHSMMYVNYRSQRFWRWKCSCWTNSCYLVTQITTSPGKIDVTILVKEHRHSGESGHKRLVGSSSFLVTLLWWEFVIEWQVATYYTYSIMWRNMLLISTGNEVLCVISMLLMESVMAPLSPNVFTKTWRRRCHCMDSWGILELRASTKEELLLPPLFMVISDMAIFDNQFLISWNMWPCY